MGKRFVYFHTIAIIAFVSILCWPVELVSSNPDGAPLEACSNMSATPHGSSSPSTTPFNYETIPSKTEINSDETLTVTIAIKKGVSGVYFKGFMVMAFKEDDDSEPLGSFLTPTDPQAKTMDCPGIFPQNAVTQTDNLNKVEVKVDWVPPPNFDGNVVFLGTYLRSKTLYWERKPSVVVRVVGSSSGSTMVGDSTTASTTTSTGSGGESTTTFSSTDRPNPSTSSSEVQSTTIYYISSTNEPNPSSLTNQIESTAKTPTTRKTTITTMSTEKMTPSPTTTVQPTDGASGPSSGSILIGILSMFIILFQL